MTLLATEAYADAEAYRRAIDKDDSDADDLILQDLTAVSRFLDKTLGRFFGQDGSLSTPAIRQYDLTDDPCVEIDDTVSIASALLDLDGDGVAETVVPSTAYVLFPRNAPTGSEPMPYTRLEFLPDRWSRFGRVTTRGYARPFLETRGITGWPAVPSAIVTATIQFTALWRLDSPRATTQISELTGQTSGVARQAQTILDRVPAVYRKRWTLR